ncbi:MAG: hypothetical protein AABZ53_03505 [Planctomycetota bacterium]
MTQLEPDIPDRILRDFPPGKAAEAIELLVAAEASGRIARCIVSASQGNLERLSDLICLAKQDYRDVIMAGEYDDTDRHVRDLRASFLIDTPEKMWVGELAVAMAKREYSLTALDTVAVELPTTTFPTDHNEGTATFEGDVGRIRVQKRRGRWTVLGDPRELAIFGLDKDFSGQRDFQDAISGCILAKRKPAVGPG